MFKCGDKNTKYFQVKAKARINQNTITYLKNEEGVWLQKRKNLREHIYDYLKKLLTSIKPIWLENLKFINPIITEDGNKNLVAIITLDELKSVVFGINPNKSSGPDGFIPEFYQKNWDIIKRDLPEVINKLHKNPSELQYLNYSIITLIPKVKSPSNIINYRPISLCNVICKSFQKL